MYYTILDIESTYICKEYTVIVTFFTIYTPPNYPRKPTYIVVITIFSFGPKELLAYFPTPFLFIKLVFYRCFIFLLIQHFSTPIGFFLYTQTINTNNTSSTGPFHQKALALELMSSIQTNTSDFFCIYILKWNPDSLGRKISHSQF